MKQYIYFIEKNIHNAIVIYGALGVKQYYYYTKQQAKQSYIRECKQNLFMEI